MLFQDCTDKCNMILASETLFCIYVSFSQVYHSVVILTRSLWTSSESEEIATKEQEVRV